VPSTKVAPFSTVIINRLLGAKISWY